MDAGALGRKDALRQLVDFLPSKSSFKKEALTIDWVDTADELVSQDRSVCVWLLPTGMPWLPCAAARVLAGKG